MTGGLVVAVFAIVRTTTEGWASLQTLVGIAIAVLLLGAFVFIEARVATQPLVRLRIFESRLLAGANVLVMLLSAVHVRHVVLRQPVPAAGARATRPSRRAWRSCR